MKCDTVNERKARSCKVAKMGQVFKLQGSRTDVVIPVQMPIKPGLLGNPVFDASRILNPDG